MKLSRLYANNSRVFPPIEFNGVDNQDFSVIFARVKRPKDSHKDSHNLGKTLLIELLDFMLLKDLANAPNHFMAKHQLLFADWVFYLEVAVPAGGFITIRRAVKDATKISFTAHEKRLQDFSARKAAWDHIDVALDRAIQLLDGQLGLDAIKPFTFRSGVGYFLRTQADYHDLFQLAKTAASPDKYWKPYLAKVFGLDPELIVQKYALDDAVGELKKKVEDIQFLLPNIRTKDLNALRMDVSSRREILGEVERRIDSFKFAQEELRISREASEELESEDAELNERLSNLDYDLAQMRGSLDRSVMFDLGHVEKVFKDTETYFGPGLKRNYEELLVFNRTITGERSRLLRQQIRLLEQERMELSRRKAEVDEKRSRYYELLRERDTFKKFKALQKEQAAQRAELQQRILQIQKLEELLEAEQNLRAKQAERTRVVEQIEAQVASGTGIHDRINTEFARMVHKVLRLSGSVFLRINHGGNVDPQYTADPPHTEIGQSSQSEGTTYRRLLCILFDLAVLKAYAGQAFFRFVYHDGILETMDDRKKLSLLSLLREFSRETGVQCIFSIIESELPRDKDGNRVEFSQNEIVRELSDDGNRGRLFRMNPF